MVGCVPEHSRSHDWLRAGSLRRPHHKLRSVLLQPRVVFIVVRVHPEHVTVESVGMIHFEQMTQLMDNYAVDDFRRGEHQQAVEVQVAFGAAASPSCLLMADGDPAGPDPEERCVVCDARGDIRPRLLGKVPYVRRGEKTLFPRPISGLLMQGKLLIDPASVLGNDPLDLAPTSAEWGLYQKPVVGDLKADGFSFAADQFVIQIVHIVVHG